MNKSIATLAMPLLLAGAAFVSTGAQAIPRPHGAADYGMLVTNTDAGAARTIAVDAGTRAINVTNGETVRFQVGGEHFAYTFDAWNSVNSVELSAIAPAGLAVPKVRIYIAPNPLSIG